MLKSHSFSYTCKRGTWKGKLGYFKQRQLTVSQNYTQGSMIVGKHWSKSLHASPLKNKELFVRESVRKKKNRTALFLSLIIHSLSFSLVSKTWVTPLLFPRDGYFTSTINDNFDELVSISMIAFDQVLAVSSIIGSFQHLYKELVHRHFARSINTRPKSPYNSIGLSKTRQY